MVRVLILLLWLNQTDAEWPQPNRVQVVINGLTGIPKALERIRDGKVSGTNLKLVRICVQEPP